MGKISVKSRPLCAIILASNSVCMNLLQTPLSSTPARTQFLFSVKECNSTVIFDAPNDIVYLYRLTEETPLLYAKLALKENGLQDYVDVMNEFNYLFPQSGKHLL